MWGGELHEGGDDRRLGHLWEGSGLLLREVYQEWGPVPSCPLFWSHCMYIIGDADFISFPSFKLLYDISRYF